MCHALLRFAWIIYCLHLETFIKKNFQMFINIHVLHIRSKERKKETFSITTSPIDLKSEDNWILYLSSVHMWWQRQLVFRRMDQFLLNMWRIIIYFKFWWFRVPGIHYAKTCRSCSVFVACRTSDGVRMVHGRWSMVLIRAKAGKQESMVSQGLSCAVDEACIL